MRDGECIDKPRGVTKDDSGDTLSSMQIEKQWYRFEDTSTDVYPCPEPENCVGGSIVNSTASRSLCREGSHGPLCAVWWVTLISRT